jgi:hypothetical protein
MPGSSAPAARTPSPSVAPIPPAEIPCQQAPGLTHCKSTHHRTTERTQATLRPEPVICDTCPRSPTRTRTRAIASPARGKQEGPTTFRPCGDRPAPLRQKRSHASGRLTHWCSYEASPPRAWLTPIDDFPNGHILRTNARWNNAPQVSCSCTLHVGAEFVRPRQASASPRTITPVSPRDCCKRFVPSYNDKPISDPAFSHWRKVHVSEPSD